MQIIWSKSPRHTAEIFRDLKKNLPGADQDPDLSKIDKIGKVGNLKLEDQDAEYNDCDPNDPMAQSLENFNRLMPREFLKRIPGVTSSNINTLMKSIKNMIELVRINEADLKKLVGHKNARAIKSFLETKVGSGQ